MEKMEMSPEERKAFEALYGAGPKAGVAEQEKKLSDLIAEFKALAAEAKKPPAGSGKKKGMTEEEKAAQLAKEKADAEAALAKTRAKIADEQEKINANVEKEAGLQADLLDLDRQEEVLKKKLADLADLGVRPGGAAQLVKEFIEKRKEREARQKDIADEGKRVAKLMEKQTRGIRLSREDREFLAGHRAKLEKEAEALVAQKRIERLQKQRDDVQKQQRDLLKKIQEQQDALLKMK